MINFGMFSVIWALTTRGNAMAIVNGFAFWRDYVRETTTAWKCSSKYMCKARMTTNNKTKQIVRMNACHSHRSAPFKIKDGVYYQF